MGNRPSLRRAIMKQEWSAVRHILETDPGKERARTKPYVVEAERVTALHLACCHNAPVDIVDALIALGQPFRESSPTELNALHFAMIPPTGPNVSPSTRVISPPEVVTSLIHAFPDDVSKTSSSQSGSLTPLHLACKRKASSSKVIRQLVQCDPHAVAIKDGRGRTAADLVRQTPWILHPIWRRRMEKILADDHALIQHDTPALADRRIAPQRRHDMPPPAPAEIVPPQRLHPVSPIRRTSSPSDPAELPVATAILLEETSPAAAALATPTAPPETMDNSGVEQGMCVLCWDNPVEMALVPCGHVCMCTDCCNELEALNQALRHQCPVCRRRYTQTLRVYQAGFSTSDK